MGTNCLTNNKGTKVIPRKILIGSMRYQHISLYGQWGIKKNLTIKHISQEGSRNNICMAQFLEEMEIINPFGKSLAIDHASNSFSSADKKQWVIQSNFQMPPKQDLLVSLLLVSNQPVASQSRALLWIREGFKKKSEMYPFGFWPPPPLKSDNHFFGNQTFL